ncbi:DUF1254 domain-containing protein [Nocardia takedensis]
MSVPLTASLSAEEAHAVGVEGYVYFYPLLTMEITRRQMTNLPPGQRPGFGPMNTFSHVRAFPTADFRAVVRPNFDTLYSSAWLDLSEEPMVVSVPDSGGRYYLLPIYDMWTDAFCVPGKRTSGTGAHEYALVGPHWHGEVPDRYEVVRAPTPLVWIIGRVQTNGPADYPTVHAIQDGLRITPLSRVGAAEQVPSAASDPSVDMTTPPLNQVNALSAAEYFVLAADLLKRHPAHVTDWSTLERLRRIGIVAGESFDHAALDPALRDALETVPADAQTLMRRMTPRLADVVDGWQMNLDSIGVYGDFYLKRAIVSMIGLGANVPEDAVYPLAITDADGSPLVGDNDYVLHFDADALPPVEAFWSLTMYDEEGFQVANELDRFALGDRDELTYNADGSLDLYLQRERPAEDRVSNWLPAPRGPLGVTMRLYAPRPAVLQGGWTPPPLRRA